MIKKIFESKFIGLIIVIVIASAVRLVAIGAVPYGIANDEVSYILSGYTIAHNGGVDIEGKFLPLSVNLDSSLSPVPVYILSIATGILSLSPFAARLPFALLGIGIVIIVYLLTLEVFKNRTMAFFAGLILSLSSWHIIVTRTVWDVIPAQFFYLLGLYIFVKKIKKGSVLWSLPAFLLGFFSYHGTKVFFAIFIVLIFALYGKILWKRRGEFLLFTAGILLIFSLFGFVALTQSVTRQQEMIFTNKGVLLDAEKKIEFDRARSTAPEFLKKIESNKITYFVEKMTYNYLGAFSSNYLFTVGDILPLVGYGVFFKGVLYLIDLPLLFLGIIFLFLRSQLLIFKSSYERTEVSHYYRNGLVLLGGGLLLSPLPSTVGAGNSYFIRSFMMSPFLSILVGIGSFVVFKYLIKFRTFKIPMLVIFIAFYGLFVSRFLYQYYFQFNTFGSEYWNGSSRQIAEYILKNYDRFNSIVVVTSEDKVFFQYALQSKANPKELHDAWKKVWPVKFGKVSFANSCFKDSELKSRLAPHTLYIVNDSCHINVRPTKTITDPMERLRVIWKLYES